MIGERYNNWTIVEYANDRIDSANKHHKRALCRCDCGYVAEKDLYKIKNGAKMCKACYLKVLPSKGIPFESKTNRYEFRNDHIIGHANNSNNYFIADIEDYNKIQNHCWYETNNRWSTTINNNRVLMHRFLLDFEDSNLVVDHINRIPNDNRKKNLRVCCQAENAKNRSLNKNNKSGFTGVYFDKIVNAWIAYISCDNKRKYLGQFKLKEDAIKTRQEFENIMFGEFSPNHQQ